MSRVEGDDGVAKSEDPRKRYKEYLQKRAKQNKESRAKWRRQKQEQIEIVYDIELQVEMAQECIDKLRQAVADIRAAGLYKKRR